MTYLIIIGLILLSAIFSGLNLGIFSLDKDDLRFKSELGDADAKKVYSLRKRSNLLLCTLLVGNVAVISALSIFLDNITSGLIAGIMTTALIVLFGEILPQAAFSRNAIYLGARTAWIARFFMFILWPVCYPLSIALDKMFGREESSYYSKKELVKLIEHHEDSSQKIIDTDEERILKGALSYSDKYVKDIMTPSHKVFSLRDDTIIDKDTMINITLSGRSRIPVYRDVLSEVVGILYTKDLAHIDHEGHTVGAVARKNIIFVDHNKKLDEVLNSFKKTRNHLFVVRSVDNNFHGIVTIEDILEEIIGEEIQDEFDK